VTKTVGSAVTAYQFGNGNNGANSNQLRSYGPSGQASTYSFSYDFNGNRSIRFDAAYNTNDYGWDDENRLISFQVAGATSIAPPGGEGSFTPPAEGSVFYYTYDHRGRRVVRDESAAGGVLTELTFSGGTSVQEANSTGTVQTELIRGSDWGGGVGGVLFTIRSGQRSYNAYNSRGDVVSTSGATGAATWQAAYEAFGSRTAEDGANDERQRANTKDEDPTGLLNEGHRYRDLDAGVFISRDPAGFVDGPNVYAYVRQNPWSAFDPEGLNMLNDINSMGKDWFGFWGGVGTGAANLATGIAKTAWNAHPAVNLGQFATGNKTGYQKQFEGGMALANTGYNLATSSEARIQALNAAANHVDAATKDPGKAGQLAFNTVTTLATGAEAGMALYSKASNLVSATARGTQAVAEAEVVTAQDLFAFGNKTAPRAPRPVQDFQVESGATVGPEYPPLPKGASTFADISQAPLTGHYHRLPAGTELPPGMSVVSDGPSVVPNSPHLPTHHTIYPTKPTTVETFAEEFLRLPWEYGGKK
jgi:RHS repeat-associated protein